MEFATAQATIAALATPAGRGGVAIIRVSGPKVKALIQHFFKKELIPRSATYLPFTAANGEILDQGIAIYFPLPHSFTGEDVLELHGHGGPVVVDLLLKEILQQGIRLARPGEFSERAFLNGKMDLVQAEAIADLINAQSEQAARSALRSLQGEFSTEIHAIVEKMIHIRTYIEAAIDFSDQEIDFLSDGNISKHIHAIQAQLKTLLAKATQGNLMREGITAVIAGAPNVGKSSLLNALSGKELAIVTDIPGTTRDVLRDYILLDDLPIHIIDTAGLRESGDVVEQEGIKRAKKEIENADLLLYVVDASNTAKADIINLKPVANAPAIIIRNKIDILQEMPTIEQTDNGYVASISVKDKAGLNALKDLIKKIVGYQQQNEGIFLARRRHIQALEAASNYVADCLLHIAENATCDIAAEDMRLAQLALNSITGEFTADDLLGQIFASFCIGK